MYTLTLNLTSNEWVKVKQEANRLWADERMSTGELARRFVLVGVEALKNVAGADLKRYTVPIPGDNDGARRARRGAIAGLSQCVRGNR